MKVKYLFLNSDNLQVVICMNESKNYYTLKECYKDPFFIYRKISKKIYFVWTVDIQHNKLQVIQHLTAYSKAVKSYSKIPLTSLNILIYIVKI